MHIGLPSHPTLYYKDKPYYSLIHCLFFYLLQYHVCFSVLAHRARAQYLFIMLLFGAPLFLGKKWVNDKLIYQLNELMNESLRTIYICTEFKHLDFFKTACKFFYLISHKELNYSFCSRYVKANPASCVYT
jgi:hypothetical protein